MFCPQEIELNDALCDRYPRDELPALNPLLECEIGFFSSFKVDNKNLLSAAFDGLWGEVKRN